MTSKSIGEKLRALQFEPEVRFGKDFVDFANPDRTRVVEVKLGARGVRDLRDSLLKLATLVAKHPEIERAFLLTSIQRSTTARTLLEWKDGIQVLVPQVRTRLALVAMIEGQLVIVPEDRETAALGRELQQLGAQDAAFRVPSSEPWQFLRRRTMGGTWKHVEVEKVLLHHWVLNEGPVTLRQITEEVGCSLPVARQAVRRLAKRGLLAQRPGRSIELEKFSRSSWTELFSAAQSVYPPVEFVDVSGHGGEVDGVLARLRRRHPENLALGGVTAARHWDPGLDLHGTPRIDVVLHVPETQGRVTSAWGSELGFVKRMDPALKLKGESGQSVVLVVHQVCRQEALFVREPSAVLPWADPVETIYHLNLLGLTAQASDMLTRLKPEARMS